MYNTHRKRQEYKILFISMPNIHTKSKNTKYSSSICTIHIQKARIQNSVLLYAEYTSTYKKQEYEIGSSICTIYIQKARIRNIVHPYAKYSYKMQEYKILLFYMRNIHAELKYTHYFSSIHTIYILNERIHRSAPMVRIIYILKNGLNINFVCSLTTKYPLVNNYGFKLLFDVKLINDCIVSSISV